MRFNDFPIRRKLTAVIVITSTIVLLLAAVGLLIYEVLDFKETMVRDLRSLADVVGQNSTSALTFNDEASAKKTLSALRANPNITSACICDKEGRIFAVFPGEEIPVAVQPGNISRYIQAKSSAGSIEDFHFLGNRLNVWKRIALDGETVGYVYLQSNLKDLYSRLEWYALVIIVLLIVSAFVAYVLSAKFQQVITAPILDLVEKMKVVSAERDYSVRVTKRTNDEVGVLIDGFNDMLEQIHGRDEELKKHREQLEDKIALRTAELSRANNELVLTVDQFKKAKEVTESANLAKSQFLARMSHEIRTPMNGILGMTELLMDTKLSERQLKLAETVRQSGEALLTILNDILDFSKIEAGKLELEVVDFNLHKLSEEVLELLAESARQKSLELISYVHDDVPAYVAGDPVRIRQIIVNLLSNAVKFTQKGEVLLNITAMEAAEGSMLLRFEVRDTGIGINPDKQSIIFESFSQADGSTTRKYGGTGLGLAISKQLAELMGGEIGMESAPGKGSTFWFTARLRNAARRVQRPGTGKELNGVNALIVDDNATNRAILDHHLTSWGMTNSCAENGSQALRMLSAAAQEGSPYDMAILDMHMPGMDGLELAHSIKADPYIASVRLVLLTSTYMECETETIRKAGIEINISKPVRQSQLYDCLVSMMGAAQCMPTALSGGYHRDGHKKLGARILLAEDNPVNQQVTQSFLENFGCEVQVASNGAEAVTALKKNAYDVVLMDCQMPEMDGYTAARIIRESEAAENNLLASQDDKPPRIPIIALTADALEGSRQQCLAAGMDDYLSKPFNQENLYKVVHRWTNALQAGDGPSETALRHAPTAESVSDDRIIRSVIDRKAWVDILAVQKDGAPDILGRLITLYLDGSPKLLSELHEAVSSREPPSILRAAHNLKSTSATLGATTLASFFRELESQARMNSTDKAVELISKIDAEYAAVETELRTELGRRRHERF